MMKKMIVAIITVMLVMIMPAAVYADEQVEEVAPPEEMEVAQTEPEEPETQAEEEAEETPEIQEETSEIESNSEAEISPVTEEIQKDEEEAAPEEISPEEAESEPTEPADCSEEDTYEDVWDEPDFEEDEEDPVYELVRLYVAHRAKQGQVDISSFGLKAGEEDELSGYLSMSFDDSIIIEENGILVAVIIGDCEDVDLEDEGGTASVEPETEDHITSSGASSSYEEPILIEEAEKEDLSDAVVAAASTKAVVRPVENESNEEPIGLFMTFLLLLATVVKHAVTLL